MNKKFLHLGAKISIGLVAILAGIVGYFAATEILAVLVGSVLGIGVGWIPSGIAGVIVRSLIAVFMVFYCGKNYKSWITNKLAES